MAEVEEKPCSSKTEEKKLEERKKTSGIKEKIQMLVGKLPLLGEMFTMLDKIGEGTFSNVYLAKLKPNYSFGAQNNSHYAIKHLIPTCSPSRVVRELKCMQEMGGADNVVGISMCLRNDDCITFIMPYQRHDRFGSYVSDMTVDETRLYIRELLVALRRVHRFNIIHRDIKPSNFLYCRDEKKFLLVDFGLAQQIDEVKLENSKDLNNRKSQLETSANKKNQLETTANNKKKQLDTLANNKKNLLETIANNKRKRLEEDDSQTGIERAKRQALQSLDSNVPLPAKPATPTLKKLEPYSWKKNISFGYRSLLGDKGSNVPLINTDWKKPQTTAEKIFARPQAPLSTQCDCDGKPQICHCCLVRKGMNTPRAGTPGFRPPEVLLKSPNQDTAVDIWAVGVIFLCILSRTYPFFRSPDDITALAELITVFGSEEIKAIAQKLGRNVICSDVKKPLNLEKVCQVLTRRKCGLDKQSAVQYPPEAYNLLYRLLDLDPSTRITAAQALVHPFIASTD